MLLRLFTHSDVADYRDEIQWVSGAVPSHPNREADPNDAGEEMQPASTMTLFTSAIALERFGPNYQFSTDGK